MRISPNQNIVVIAWSVMGIVLIALGSRLLAARHLQPESVAREIAPLTTPDPAAAPTPLEELWRKHKIQIPLDPLRNPLPRHDLLSQPIRLDPRSPAWASDVLSLELAVVEKTHAMGHRDTHAVLLRIRNVSKTPVAFRVDTDEGKLFVPCQTPRRAQAHQFLLPAGASVERMEGCTAMPDGVDLVVRRVQALSLPEAAVITLSRVLQPLGLSYRMRAQHRTPDAQLLPPCIIPDAETLQRRISENPNAWFDILDFLARHDCATEKLP